MKFDETRLHLAAQRRVYHAWRSRLHGQAFVTQRDLPLSDMAGELAHVSLLMREGDEFRFRLAGSALRWLLGREARDLTTAAISFCRDQYAWNEAPDYALQDVSPSASRAPVTLKDLGQSENRPPVRFGRMVHFWMRLPMSSDGVAADLVLCHDRFLPVEALSDPDSAAQEVNRRMRLDVLEPEVA